MYIFTYLYNLFIKSSESTQNDSNTNKLNDSQKYEKPSGYKNINSNSID